MKFIEEIRALLGSYNKDIKVIRDDTTKELFNIILKNPTHQLAPISIGEVRVGRFYVIKYNYNGNKLWCPILTIPPVPNKNEEGVLERQLKISNIKKILYAINFDYLPLKYKISLIETIINNNLNTYEKNDDKISSGAKVKEENVFRIEWIYNFLKYHDKNYSITAYDISKILNVYEVSSTLLDRFIFLDTYYINNRMMYDTLSNIANEDMRKEFSKKIKMFEEILKMYKDDVEVFFKSLRNFEKNLKLFDNL